MIGRLVLARIWKYQAVAFEGYGGGGFLFCAYYFSQDRFFEHVCIMKKENFTARNCDFDFKSNIPAKYFW